MDRHSARQRVRERTKLRDSEGARQRVRNRGAETDAETETGTHTLAREGASIDRQRQGRQRGRERR